MVRLLFDEPLSEELCEALADIFPDSLHIRLLGRGGAADAAVWDLARMHGCLLVSKDEDFDGLAVLGGAHGGLGERPVQRHVAIFAPPVPSFLPAD